MRVHARFGTIRSLALLTVCGAALSGLPAPAQDNGAPPPPATQDNGGPPSRAGRPDPAQMQARHLEMMTKRLNLSPDQVSQVKAIDDDTMNQMLALRNDTATPREQKRTKMQGIHQAQNEKVRAVLNDEQKTKYDAMEARRQDHMRDRGGMGHGQDAPPPPPTAQQ